MHVKIIYLQVRSYKHQSWFYLFKSKQAHYVLSNKKIELIKEKCLFYAFFETRSSNLFSNTYLLNAADVINIRLSLQILNKKCKLHET